MSGGHTFYPLACASDSAPPSLQFSEQTGQSLELPSQPEPVHFEVLGKRQISKYINILFLQSSNAAAERLERLNAEGRMPPRGTNMGVPLWRTIMAPFFMPRDGFELIFWMLHCSDKDSSRNILLGNRRVYA